MCFSSDVPTPPPPPQGEKAADPVKRKRPVGQTATVLTGPAGATPSTLNTGGTTLLGG